MPALYITLLLVSLLITSGCAVRVAPGGGPGDTTRPFVVGSIPANNSRSVNPSEIRIQFSEYVAPGVVSAVSISPDVRFSREFAGDHMKLIFLDTLVANTTYNVAMDADWTDARNNKPAQAWSVVFATGPDIDTGFISGTVFTDKVENVIVSAVRINESMEFDFRTTKAPYRVPVGSSRFFSLTGLGDGVYRVIAFRDDNRNGIVDKAEWFCVSAMDVTVLDGSSAALRLRLSAPADVEPPFVVDIRALSDRSVRVNFSEPVVINHSRGEFVVTDTAGKPVGRAMATLIARSANQVLVVMDTGIAATSLMFMIPDGVISDTAGNMLMEANRNLRVTTGSIQFSDPPRITTVLPRDSSTSVNIQPSLSVEFSQPMATTDIGVMAYVVSLSDSVEITPTWEQPSRLSFALPRLLKGDTWYTAYVVLRNPSAFAGGRMNDTMVTTRFKTGDRIDNGTMTGVIIDSSGTHQPHTVKLFHDEDGKFTLLSYPKDSMFAGITLKPGYYLAEAYMDLNGNGKWDSGALEPFTHSEPFVPLDFKAEVRPRWALENIRIVIPRY